jgi:hypothetical protein
MHNVLGCMTVLEVLDFVYHNNVLMRNYCLCIAHNRQQGDVAENGKEN